ncbi:protein mbtH [Chromobacterium sp. LK1]|uniref:MbtH family protein n=1 Tax=Chromobacterium sp. LK1 TaxID=1628193 RepID=UPI000653E89C|nr:MbtH family NRPS accessory protein [Chromobacterium sp. LK1]KMN31395.1 protein mbtH [Chromobacterium sp. LK1]
MSNLFDLPDGEFMVLRNQQGSHSLWPCAIAVPAGWSVAHGPAPRQDCTRYIETIWRDMRPEHIAA